VKSLIFVMGCSLFACTADTFSADDAGDAAGDGKVGLHEDAGESGDSGIDSEDSSSESSASDGGITDATIDGVTPPTSYRVFVTAETYSPNFGGLGGADGDCNSVASKAGLGGSWKAWLSASFQSAASRLVHSSVPYKLVDGTVVALDWGHLTSGTLAHDIDKDENGVVVGYDGGYSIMVITGTYYGGTSATSDETCLDWTTSVAGNEGIGGSANWSTKFWTQASVVDCANNAPFHLYCIEQ
jgi:hypothetical protein